MESTKARLMGNAPWLPPVISRRSGFDGFCGCALRLLLQAFLFGLIGAI